MEVLASPFFTAHTVFSERKGEAKALETRELFVDTVTVEDETGSTRCWDYLILIHQVEEGAASWESYGIKGVDRQGGQGVVVPHITTNAQRIWELARLLVDHQVSLTHVTDVIEDWL